MEAFLRLKFSVHYVNRNFLFTLAICAYLLISTNKDLRVTCT